MGKSTTQKELIQYSLEEQLKKLFEGITYENDQMKVGVKKINPKEELDTLYRRYKNEIVGPEFPNEEVEDLLPYAESFNEKRFWLVDENPKVRLQNGQQLVSQDGQSFVIKAGEFLNGGVLNDGISEDRQVALERVKTKANKFVYVYRNKKIEKPNSKLYVSIEGEYAIKIFYKPFVRIYFNLLPDKDAILAWVNYLQKTFNEHRIPFQLKYPFNLKNYIYSDSGVLYVSQNHFHIVILLLNDVFEHLADLKILGESVPLFTLQLHKGIGFAEDPFFVKDSFGEHRCKLILEVLKKNNLNSDDIARKITIDKIATEIENKGYGNGFFRNPNTNYKYDFIENSIVVPLFKTFWSSKTYSNAKKASQKLFFKPEIVAKASLHIDSFYRKYNDKYFSYKDLYEEYRNRSGKYRFLALAENYAKELIEKAILDAKKSKDEYQWITYDEGTDESKRKIVFYRLVDEDEKAMIQYFLLKLAEVSKNEYYRTHALKITTKGGIIKEPAQAGDYDKLFQSLQDFIAKNPKQVEVLEKIQKTIDEIKSIKDLSGLDEKLRPLVEIIDDNFEKISLPLKNTFGNYEYCPTFNGKLKIAFIFLVISSPDNFALFINETQTWFNKNKKKVEKTIIKWKKLHEFLTQHPVADT